LTLVETAKDKKGKARKLVQDLKSENVHLHKIVEQSSGLAISYEKTVQKLMESKQEFKTELALPIARSILQKTADKNQC
jgi:hypothetical protein